MSSNKEESEAKRRAFHEDLDRLWDQVRESKEEPDVIRSAFHEDLDRLWDQVREEYRESTRDTEKSPFNWDKPSFIPMSRGDGVPMTKKDEANPDTDNMILYSDEDFVPIQKKERHISPLVLEKIAQDKLDAIWRRSPRSYTPDMY